MTEVPLPSAGNLESWGSIDTYESFGAATADWLEGRRSYHPTYAADGPDPETLDLIPDLVAINRLGFVTDGSQPGMPLDDTNSAQRAFLTGYSSESTVGAISHGLRHTDLIVLSFPPGAVGCGSIVVTLDAGEEHTWMGRADARSDVELYEDRAGSRLAKLVASGWVLQIIDPVWGRNDRLLPAVRQALEARS